MGGRWDHTKYGRTSSAPRASVSFYDKQQSVPLAASGKRTTKRREMKRAEVDESRSVESLLIININFTWQPNVFVFRDVSNLSRDLRTTPNGSTWRTETGARPCKNARSRDAMKRRAVKRQLFIVRVIAQQR